jgi:TetR/AcrR family transcriptional regulator
MTATPIREKRQERRPHDAEATREALLRAATDVFAEVGFDGARVDEIAERAGINKRMIYAYFGDKESLYREVVRSRLAVPPFFAAEDADPWTTLVAAVRWYFGMLASDRAFARLLAWGMVTDHGGHAILLSGAAPAMELLANAVRRGVAAGTIRADVDPETLRTGIVSVCIGYFLQHDAMVAAQSAEGRAPFTDEIFLDRVCRALFDGIAARKASP